VLNSLRPLLLIPFSLDYKRSTPRLCSTGLAVASHDDALSSGASLRFRREDCYALIGVSAHTSSTGFQTVPPLASMQFDESKLDVCVARNCGRDREGRCKNLCNCRREDNVKGRAEQSEFVDIISNIYKRDVAICYVRDLMAPL